MFAIYFDIFKYLFEKVKEGGEILCLFVYFQPCRLDVICDRSDGMRKSLKNANEQVVAIAKNRRVHVPLSLPSRLVLLFLHDWPTKVFHMIDAREALNYSGSYK
jgi:hypothetical protein